MVLIVKKVEDQSFGSSGTYIRKHNSHWSDRPGATLLDTSELIIFWRQWSLSQPVADGRVTFRSHAEVRPPPPWGAHELMAVRLTGAGRTAGGAEEVVVAKQRENMLRGEEGGQTIVDRVRPSPWSLRLPRHTRGTHSGPGATTASGPVLPRHFSKSSSIHCGWCAKSSVTSSNRLQPSCRLTATVPWP
jgi:hypothetical protein